jgi:hypothetical protein
VTNTTDAVAGTATGSESGSGTATSASSGDGTYWYLIPDGQVDGTITMSAANQRSHLYSANYSKDTSEVWMANGSASVDESGEYHQSYAGGATTEASGGGVSSGNLFAWTNTSTISEDGADNSEYSYTGERSRGT